MADQIFFWATKLGSGGLLSHNSPSEPFVDERKATRIVPVAAATGELLVLNSTPARPSLTPTVCVLRPDHSIHINAPWIGGKLEPVFIYRGLEGASNGPVVAGNTIGEAFPGQAGLNRPRTYTMSFRILLSPIGRAPLNHPETQARLREYLAPDSGARFFPPMAFYHALKNFPTADTAIAAAHENHPALANPSRRMIIEIRDDRDRPYATKDLQVYLHQNRQGGLSAPEVIVGGGYLGKEPAGTPARSVHVFNRPGGEIECQYSLYIEDHLISQLPSGGGTMRTLESGWIDKGQVNQGDVYWAVQVMGLANKDGFSSWFVENQKAFDTSEYETKQTAMSRYTTGNKVTPLIDGKDTYHSMATALKSARGSGSYIRLAGWGLDYDFDLSGTKSTFADLLSEAVKTGCKANLMMSGHLPNAGDIFAKLHKAATVSFQGLVANINLFSSHHQKLLIVKSPTGRVAYCGGADIRLDRMDDNNHCVLGRLHEAHAKIEGPAVADLEATFIDRWNLQSEYTPHLRPLAYPDSAVTKSGSHLVQVARTYSNGKYGVPLIGKKSCPAPDTTVLKSLLNAIHKAETFIYVEDQYLTPYPGSIPYHDFEDTVGVMNALFATLAKPQFKFLLVMIGNHTDLPQDRIRRARFLGPLMKKFPGKVHAFFLARTCKTAKRDAETQQPPMQSIGAMVLEQMRLQGMDVGKEKRSKSGDQSHADEVYVHAKTWIVDDAYATIGSANCNRRSYTNDSELNINITDATLKNGGRDVVRNYRMDLWAEHLHVDRQWLEDPVLAQHYWLRQFDGSRHRPYDVHDTDIISILLPWEILDPDGR